MPAVAQPPVVLVHGFATSAARTWRDNGWVDLLEDARREIIAPDLLGHGNSPKPHDGRAYDELEATLLESFPTEPVDAVGFSLGARCLLVLASQHPQQFNRLVVAGVGANLFRHDDHELLASALDGFVAGITQPLDDPVGRYFQQLASADDADPAALAALLRRPNPPPITAESLEAVSCNVLVVIGDRDFAGPGEPLVERLPTGELLTLAGLDHFATPKDFRFIDAALSFIGAQP